jgi:hypothetical protein
MTLKKERIIFFVEPESTVWFLRRGKKYGSMLGNNLLHRYPKPGSAGNFFL